MKITIAIILVIIIISFFIIKKRRKSPEVKTSSPCLESMKELAKLNANPNFTIKG